jgi:hypothetical protein
MNKCLACNNCFGQHKGKPGRCVVLEKIGCDEPPCVGAKNCVFYKSSEQAKADRQSVYPRLASLPLTHQRCIADTYYRGKMPWAEGGAAQ